ncbi:TPA: HNH endonuclease [Stenotrophomonas maltophilia]
MFDCLYCAKTTDPAESSLEHAIPQFMGGARAPARFHLSNVCETCNNRLGLFVDASYAKAWLTTNALATAARNLYLSNDDPGLPLIYIGHATINGLIVPEGHVAEHWIGPSGETVVWVRLHDKRMDAYAGGNPIDAKRAPSVIYLVPTAGDERLEMAIRSLKRMGGRKVRTILCAEVLDADGRQASPATLGFDVADMAEIDAADAIRAQALTGQMGARVVMNLTFDHRFICKLALSVGYALFGEPFLDQSTAADFRLGVWPKLGAQKPPVRGASSLTAHAKVIARRTAYPSAVLLFVMRAGDQWVLTLTIDPQLTFSVALGPGTLKGHEVDLEAGYALVLIPYLEQTVELSLTALIDHLLGGAPVPELERLDQRKQASERIWRSLPSM